MGMIRAYSSPDSKVHGANMGPSWGRQDPVGPHVGPMNFALWGFTRSNVSIHLGKEIFHFFIRGDRL